MRVTIEIERDKNKTAVEFWKEIKALCEFLNAEVVIKVKEPEPLG